MLIKTGIDLQIRQFDETVYVIIKSYFQQSDIPYYRIQEYKRSYFIIISLIEK